MQQFADDSVIKNLSSIYPRFFCDYSSFHDFLLLEKRVILKVIYSKIVQNSLKFEFIDRLLEKLPQKV